MYHLWLAKLYRLTFQKCYCFALHDVSTHKAKLLWFTYHPEEWEHAFLLHFCHYFCKLQVYHTGIMFHTALFYENQLNVYLLLSCFQPLSEIEMYLIKNLPCSTVQNLLSPLISHNFLILPASRFSFACSTFIQKFIL